LHSGGVVLRVQDGWVKSHTTWGRLTASGQLRLNDCDLSRTYFDADVRNPEFLSPFDCLTSGSVYVLQAFVVYVLLRRDYNVPLTHLPALLEESFSTACELIREGFDHSKSAPVRKQPFKLANQNAAKTKLSARNSRQTPQHNPAQISAHMIEPNTEKDERIAKLESQVLLLREELATSKTMLERHYVFEVTMGKLKLELQKPHQIAVLPPVWKAYELYTLTKPSVKMGAPAVRILPADLNEAFQRRSRFKRLATHLETPVPRRHGGHPAKN